MLTLIDYLSARLRQRTPSLHHFRHSDSRIRVTRSRAPSLSRSIASLFTFQLPSPVPAPQRGGRRRRRTEALVVLGRYKCLTIRPDYDSDLLPRAVLRLLTGPRTLFTSYQASTWSFLARLTHSAYKQQSTSLMHDGELVWQRIDHTRH